MRYEDFFKQAFGREPYEFQFEMAEGELPSIVGAPTGAGKTAAALGAWLWQRLHDESLNNNQRVGRRLIYCLPMRVLVEQTAKVALDAVRRLEEAGVVEKGRFRVYVLMGGETADEWDSNPEREYIIVGTQDMLLSRALNRGYAMSRYRWPVHFGLLNNDCLWVFDEVQLMGSGLATSVQLQAFRRLFGAFGPVKTLWMSATIDRDWLKTADCDLGRDVQGVRSLNLDREGSKTIHEVMCARKKLRPAGVKAQETEKLAKKVLESHKAGSRTLVIVNTVPRAVELYQTLKEKIEAGRHEQGRKKRSVPAGSTPELVLIHSRFRPWERKERVEKLLAEPKEGGTIIVSTQVVEAGVDVSAQTLFTELAPWSSLVQRFGRCNRRGECEEAEIFWVDVKDADAAPYDPEDLKRARKHLKALEGKDVGPKELARYIEGLGEKERKELLTFDHVYVIRPHDLHGLFSTEPDLAGGFTDVSNFVRNIEREADVYVYWREFKDKPAKDEPPPRRDELCPVRFFRLKDLLGKSGVAWMWNAEERAWKALGANEIKPGMTLLLSTSQGGYDPELGWTGESGDKPGVIEDEASSNALMINVQESLDDDQLSETDWVSLPDHLKDAEAEAKEIVSAINFDDDEIWKQCYPSVIHAAWWHDVGKALRRWQQSGKDQLLQIKEKSEEFLKKNPNGPEADFVRGFLEKLKELESDGTFWAKFPGLEQKLKLSGLPIDAQKRIKKAITAPFLPGLRHEAASALAAWQKWRKGTEDWTALAVYLVACHHGKVRTVLRSTQKWRKAAAVQTQNPTYTAEQREDEIAKEIFGITSEELLPKLDGWLEDSTSLDLRLSVFGSVGKWDADFFELEEPSWVQMVAELLGPEIPGELVTKDAIPEKEPRELGPFRLAFLEALIRAADVKASQVPGRLREIEMSKFKIIPCEGVRPDNLGGYFVGLGLLSALTKKWPTVRGCWRNGCFYIVGDLSKEDIEAFLLGDWDAPQYERWWSDPQKADTKAKSDRKIWEHRSNKKEVYKVLHLDAHIVGVGRNQFNPVFGTGGNIGKRDLAKASEEAKKLIREDKTKKKVRDWLKYTLWAEGKPELPELSSTGTWFVYANKTFNSGQDWFEEGKISPWSFLLALEGALLLVGSVNRRLSSISRPYAVFPFVTDRPSPRTEGEVGLARAEFWAPLWEYPATLMEIRALLERGLARIGNRDCRAPHEFALAARAAGVDAGVKEFARFVLRQTTSSQVYEAIPQEHIEVSPVVTLESELIEPLLPWLDRLPYEPSDSKQRGKFKGLRGPVEEAIVKIAERPDDAERWQQLLLLLADVQTRIDRNQSLRKSCAAVPRLSSLWFDKAWPEPPTEIRIARAIASIGTNTDMPILCNVFGVCVDKKGAPFFPGERPQSAVWHHGDVVQVLADVLERRLVDAKPTEELPLAARYFCNAAEVEALLEGALDWEMIGRWIPPLSLIHWSRPEERDTDNRSLNEHAADGHYLLSALFRPFFCPSRIELAGKELFPERLKPRSLIARRLLNLIRQGELEEAIKLSESRYLAAKFPIVAPSLVETQRHDAIAASLLVPINVRDIVSGLRRWLQPEKSQPEKSKEV